MRLTSVTASFTLPASNASHSEEERIMFWLRVHALPPWLLVCRSLILRESTLHSLHFHATFLFKSEYRAALAAASRTNGGAALALRDGCLPLCVCCAEAGACHAARCERDTIRISRAHDASPAIRELFVPFLGYGKTPSCPWRGSAAISAAFIAAGAPGFYSFRWRQRRLRLPYNKLARDVGAGRRQAASGRRDERRRAANSPEAGERRSESSAPAGVKTAAWHQAHRLRETLSK